MRENITNPTPMESLSFNGFQKPLHDISKEQDPMAISNISISSNVYYGYQPIRIPNNGETMDTEDLNKFCSRMDTVPHPVNRKRTRDHTEPSQEEWKKRRQNEPVNVPVFTNKCLPIPISQLDEDLLRETHGCSHYHWVSSNM